MGVNNKEPKETALPEPQRKGVPGLFSRSLYLWMFPVYYNAFHRDLEEYDLRPANYQYDSKVCGDILERNWTAEETAAKAAGREPSLFKALVKSFGWSFMRGGLMQFIFVSLRTGTPILFGQLLLYWSADSTMSRETAVYFAVSMIVCNWVAAYMNHHGNLYSQQYGMKLRVATSSLMFRKIMRMGNSALGDTTAGKVVNLLSNDLQRFDMVFTFLHYLWIIPIQLVAVCYLGYMQAGYAALIGMAALIIIALPIQGGLGQMIGKVRFRNAEKTDERVKLMSEVINGIQVIKMYAWEIPFQKIVGEKRANELKEVRKATILRTIFIGFIIFTERTAMFFTILTFILLGNAMSATIIYPLQQFLSAAQINITFVLPYVLSFVAETRVSLRRVQEFLNLEELPDAEGKNTYPVTNLFRKLTENSKEAEGSVRPVSFNSKSVELYSGPKINEGLGVRNAPHRRSMSQGDDSALVVRNVSASWTSDPNFLALKNVSFRLRRGKLCAIIGAVGSGKSSILQLLLKELPAASGTFSINGKVSYASQEAWLFPSTVRENILFGLPYDSDKYKRVCRVCALEKDFKQFPFGDQTLVGERGVSLSGGQRARINLARAIYREKALPGSRHTAAWLFDVGVLAEMTKSETMKARQVVKVDVYLLDDPLSAVDANVGRQLFEGCINGHLRGKTRILVTHQIHFLKAADFIIVMNEGRIENMGTFDDLVSSGKDFSLMLSSQEKEKEGDSLSAKSSEDNEKGLLLRQLSTKSEAEELPQFEAQEMAKEERQSGNLKWEVISAYFTAGGNICFIMFAMLLIFSATVSAAGADYWVSYWSNQMASYEEEVGAEVETGLGVLVGQFTTGQYLIIHGCIIATCILLTHARVLVFAELCVSASKNLHNSMFSTMIKGIMRFFDTSSSGRILNRFTKDMGSLDEILPRTLLDVLQIYGTLVAILVLNAIALYWTLIPSAVLLVVFFFMVRVYLRAAQGIKRLEGTTKSPVFGMVTSSLNGIATIRSCGAQDRLVKEFDKQQDLHTAAWNGYLVGGTSFGFYLDSTCLVYLTAVIFVFLFVDFGDAIPVGTVGLAVTQSNMLTAMLQHGARMLVEFLAQLTSVERVLEYTRIETEKDLYEGQLAIAPTWPQEGRVIFDNVSMRYAPDETPVLKNLNIVIEKGWKVGIVGRTGAGKSSLISAMFRFAYLDGQILIDGVDTALVARQSLRSKISIIPQEPVLFSATIRYNLDPFDIYSDDDLWRALEQVDLKSAVPSLDFKVTEGGSNFSIGQRQLMCLARAVLRSNRILIMDEATANVDPQTDSFIQQTIRQEFAQCTVLTIAHRLNTIMDSDRVLVMSFGEVAEFDHPYILLSDPNSHLSAMVKETGDKNSAKLFRIAKDAYFQSNVKENAR